MKCIFIFGQRRERWSRNVHTTTLLIIVHIISFKGIDNEKERDVILRMKSSSLIIETAHALDLVHWIRQCYTNNFHGRDLEATLKKIPYTKLTLNDYPLGGLEKAYKSFCAFYGLEPLGSFTIAIQLMATRSNTTFDLNGYQTDNDNNYQPLFKALLINTVVDRFIITANGGRPSRSLKGFILALLASSTICRKYYFYDIDLTTAFCGRMAEAAKLNKDMVNTLSFHPLLIGGRLMLLYLQ